MLNAFRLKRMNEALLKGYMQARLGEVDTLPTSILVLPTSRCNFRCVMCGQRDNRSYARQDIPREGLELLAALMPFAQDVWINGGGEPLLYPHILELLDAVGHKGVRVRMISNGAAMTPPVARKIVESGVSAVRISINAARPQTYRDIHWFPMHKVLANMARLMEYNQELGGHTEVQFNFVALRRNIEELPQLVTMAHEFGVREINVVHASIFRAEIVPDSLFFHRELSNEVMRRAKRLADRLGVQLHYPVPFGEPDGEHSLSKVKCEDPWRSLMITPDGTLGFCCISPSIGRLGETPFDAMWNGALVQEVRRTVNTENEIPLCRNCGVGKKKQRDALESFFAANVLDEAKKYARARSLTPQVGTAE